MYKDYTHIQSRASTKDKAEYDEVLEEKYANRRQRLTIAIEELTTQVVINLERVIKSVSKRPKPGKVSQKSEQKMLNQQLIEKVQ